MKECSRIIKNYYELVKVDKRKLIPYYIGYFFNCILELFLPIYVAKITDNLTQSLYDKALICVMLYLIIKVVISLLSYSNMKNYSNFFKHNYITLYQKIVQKIYTLSESEKQKIKTGRMINNLTLDIISVGEMADDFLTVLINVFKILFLFLYFFYFNYIFCFFLIGVEILYILLSTYLTNQATIYARKQRNVNEKGINLINETLLGLKDIQTLDFSKSFNEKYENIYSSWQKIYTKKRKYQINRKTLLKIFLSFIKAFVYVLCIVFLIKKKLNIEQLLIIISYFEALFISTEIVMSSFEKVKEQNISIERLKEVVDEKKIKNNSCEKITECAGKIEFKKVYFSYNNKELLSNLNFTIHPNKITAISGSNGSGKTTLINLILRLYEPKKGTILLDNKKINKIEKSSYLKEMAVLNQETYLFNLSIRKNFDLINKDHEKQKEICELIGIASFIEKLPKGYDTVIDEKSNNLSGGQKRLLSLARTLLKESKILILDEVTSSLDLQSIENIKQILQKLKETHTILIITHKKEILKLADKVIALNDKK